MLISVCMCTYKRPHLSHTLHSISELQLLKGIELEVIVIDNDEELSGRSIVEDIKIGYPHKLSYYSETEKNISVARNAYLKVAMGEWIASLDDDEIADQYWLSYLLETANKFNADVVFGQVKNLYPADAEEWLIKGGFFDRTVRDTGTQVSSGGTGCTLIKSQALKDTGYNFDKSFGLTGGEDAQLFHRLNNAGYKLVYCKEAFVTELVEENRINKKYLIQRAIRIGETYSRYRFPKGTKDKVPLHILKTGTKFFYWGLLALVYLPQGEHKSFKYRLKMLDCFGKIKFFFNTKAIELYR